MPLRHATTATKDDLARPCSSGGKETPQLRGSWERRIRKRDYHLHRGAQSIEGKRVENGLPGAVVWLPLGERFPSLAPAILLLLSGNCPKLSRPGT